MSLEVMRGNVYLVDLYTEVGKENAGTLKNVIVVSNNINNRYAPIINVIPISESIKEQELPTHIAIHADESGLNNSSTAVVEQLRTISKDRVKKLTGILSKETLKEIEVAISFQFGLNSEESK